MWLIVLLLYIPTLHASIRVFNCPYIPITVEGVTDYEFVSVIVLHFLSIQPILQVDHFDTNINLFFSAGITMAVLHVSRTLITGVCYY